MLKTGCLITQCFDFIFLGKELEKHATEFSYDQSGYSVYNPVRVI
jgi:hypothetical protein